MSQKKKIQIATDEEVKQYGTPAQGDADSPDEQDASGSPVQAGRQESAASTGGESEAAEPDEVRHLREQAESWKDKYLRAKAETQNIQRRAANERAAATAAAYAAVIKALLPVLDDLERTLEASKSAENVASMVEGVRLIYENMQKVLRGFGLEPIEAVGQAFDPAVHEAVMQRPSAEHPDKTIVEQVQRGYRLGDRLLRPAKVVVSQAPSRQEQEGAAASDAEPAADQAGGPAE